jgi:crotonobetainyl-CoA:carnitine CoA-transferase CaiB-like acyl-CoA transferase
MPKTTTRPTIRIHDIETNEVTDREMNDAEFAQYEADKATKAIAAEAKAKAEADKAALLERLGLTEDELKTILG